MSTDKITVNKPTIHRLAASAIKSLEQKGLKPKPEHIVWIQDAAIKMRQRNARKVQQLVDWPTPCGGVLLYPLSFGALEWVRTLDLELQNDTIVQAFACAHSHEPETLIRLVDRTETIRTIKAWKKNIACSPKALSVALNAVISNEGEVVEIESAVPKKDPAENSDKAVDFGVLVLALCKKYPGTTPKYWMFEVSIDFALDALTYSSTDGGEVNGDEINAHITFRSILAAVEKELKEATDER